MMMNMNRGKQWANVKMIMFAQCLIACKKPDWKIMRRDLWLDLKSNESSILARLIIRPQGDFHPFNRFLYPIPMTLWLLKHLIYFNLKFIVITMKSYICPWKPMIQIRILNMIYILCLWRPRFENPGCMRVHRFTDLSHNIAKISINGLLLCFVVFLTQSHIQLSEDVPLHIKRYIGFSNFISMYALKRKE